MKTFKKLLEDIGMAMPANNIGTGHIAGTKQAGDDPPILPKQKKPIVLKRKLPKM